MIRRLSALGAAAAALLASMSVLGGSPALAAYPGQVGLVVFTSVDSHGVTQIWTINPATGTRRQLTTTGGQNPCWSPFGTQIAFDRGGDLWVMTATGTQQRDITNTSKVVEQDPSWSPNGRRIVYTRDLSGAVDIAVANTDGSNRKVITSNRASDYSPAWSTTNKIAFVSDRSGIPQIWVMNQDGANQHNVSRQSSDDVAPAWSPDGMHIAYAGPLDPPHSVGGDLWTMNADGSAKTPVIHQQTYSDGADPSWSADGTMLEFSANNGLGAQRLWTYSFTTGTQTQLTNEATQPYDRSGDWQPVHTAQLTLSRNSGKPGVTLHLTGSHFAKDENVTLSFVRGARSTPLTTVRTGHKGALSTSVTIPHQVASGAARIVATGTVSNLTAHAPFTVT